MILPDQDQSYAVIPVTGTAPPGSELVVDVASVDGSLELAGFLIGSNSDGQTGPGYITAPACGIVTSHGPGRPGHRSPRHAHRDQRPRRRDGYGPRRRPRAGRRAHGLRSRVEPERRLRNRGDGPGGNLLEQSRRHDLFPHRQRHQLRRASRPFLRDFRRHGRLRHGRAARHEQLLRRHGRLLSSPDHGRAARSALGRDARREHHPDAAGGRNSGAVPCVDVACRRELPGRPDGPSVLCVRGDDLPQRSDGRLRRGARTIARAIPPCASRWPSSS